MQTEIISPAIAGYRMLMILAQVDGHVDEEEREVIRQYLNEKFPFQLNPDQESNAIFKEEDEFMTAAMDFYQSASTEEQTEFLQFAFDLIKADYKITSEENKYINLLYDVWQLDLEE
jgi:uncharacterized tellurite resistance protein B-like protein